MKPMARISNLDLTNDIFNQEKRFNFLVTKHNIVHTSEFHD